MHRGRDAEGIEMEETLGEVFPHHPTSGSGERRKLPSGVPGAAPAENGFYAYFRSERSHPEHHAFSVFLSDGGAPNVAGPGKTFPLPPLEGPVCFLNKLMISMIQTCPGFDALAARAGRILPIQSGLAMIWSWKQADAGVRSRLMR